MEMTEVLERLTKLPPAKRAEVEKEALEATKNLRWIPNPGPQTEAYYSEADCLLYGGQPGGGKSQLILGLAFNCHERSLVLRRKYGDLGRLIEDTLKINGGRKGFNGSPPPKLRISKTQQIEFGAAHRIGDEQDWMGRGRDLLGVDEACHFAESQIRFLMGWNRSETEGQRVRTVLATNPPLTAEGMWVTRMFAPWLDQAYHDPAKPGELRWVVSDDDGKDTWVDGPGDYEVIVAGERKNVKAMSRTYIAASVEDNPEYSRSSYKTQLYAMPEPFRSLLLGGFKTSFQDAPNQAIPTSWLTAAQERWTAKAPHLVPQCAIGVDATGGATDPMVLAPRHDGYFPPLLVIPAKDIPAERAGRMGAGIVVAHRRDNCPVIVDMGGGYGGPMYEQLRANGIEAIAYKGAEKSTRRTKDGSLGFFNKRSEVVWKFREALDPDQPNGSNIALPPDQELIADLASFTVDTEFNGIKIESKESINDRLGRSTNKGDAVIMSWSSGATYVTDGSIWAARSEEHGRLRNNNPRVIMSDGPRLTGKQRR